MGINPNSPEPDFACMHVAGHDGPRHSQSFASLFDLNRQTIALLVDVATTPIDDRIWPGWRALGSELTRLDAAQREGLARCPFSLIDAGLCKALRRSRTGHLLVEPVQEELPLSSMPLQIRLDHLAHAVWLFAWHLVRSDVIAAKLVFAMDPTTTSLMAQVTLTEIRHIAQEQVLNGRVHLRWHNRPEVWSRLIHTASSQHPEACAEVTTRGLQLFLQELLTEEHRA